MASAAETFRIHEIPYFGGPEKIFFSQRRPSVALAASLFQWLVSAAFAASWATAAVSWASSGVSGSSTTSQTA